MVGEECDGIRKCWEPVSRFKFALLAWLSVAMNTSMNMDLKIIFPFSATFMDRNAIGMGFKFALPKWAPWLNEPNGIIFWRFCKKRKKKTKWKDSKHMYNEYKGWIPFWQVWRTAGSHSCGSCSSSPNGGTHPSPRYTSLHRSSSVPNPPN